MSSSQPSPSTAPPRSPFGETLDRYAGYEAVECPECGEVGLDVWITEGATAGRGVCVSSGCEVEHGTLLDLTEEASGGAL